MLYFAADIPGNGKKTLTLVKDETVAPAPAAKSSVELLTSTDKDVLTAESGALRFGLKNGSSSLFETLSAAGTVLQCDDQRRACYMMLQ